MGSTKSVLANIGEALTLKSSEFAFLNPPLISASNSNIVDLAGNARKLRDPSKTIRPAMGVERVMLNEFTLSNFEKGSNGEPVYNINNDDRIKAVGGWTQYTASGYGNRLEAQSDNNAYIEVVFYGTGLNLLTLFDSNSRDYQVSVDGGAEVLTATGSASNVLGSRNYGTNQIHRVAHGLTQGVHTVRIRRGSGSGNFYGVEILNSSSSISVPQGELFAQGRKFATTNAQTIAYNSGFDGSPILNGRGGHVVEYVSSQGLAGKVIQQTEAASAFLTSASHLNEEVIRKINFREFGANRADDFSTLGDTVSDRAYVLDDNTTCLVGDDVRVFTSGGTLQNAPGVYTNGSGSAGGITLYFVGTGLDIITNYGNQSETITIYVDGSSVGTIPYLANVRNRLVKIASGLPYGVHTVRLERGGGGSDFMNISDFIIYAPKKPTVPSNAQEVGEYFLTANYIGTSVPGADTPLLVPRGTVRKASSREISFFGTWAANFTVSNAFTHGFSVDSSTNGSYFEYYFFGTGVEVIARGSAASTNSTIQIDGVAYTGAATATGGTWTPGTSTWLAGTTEGGRLQINSLTLGVHKIRVTHADTNQIRVMGFEIITPIHFPNSEVGSLSMVSSLVMPKTASKTLDLSKAKAWLTFDLANSIILESMNVSGVIKSVTGQATVFFEKPFKNKNFVAVGLSYSNAGENIYAPQLTTEQGPISANASSVKIINSSGTAVDRTFTIAYFGQLEDEE